MTVEWNSQFHQLVNTKFMFVGGNYHLSFFWPTLANVNIHVEIWRRDWHCHWSGIRKQKQIQLILDLRVYIGYHPGYPLLVFGFSSIPLSSLKGSKVSAPLSSRVNCLLLFWQVRNLFEICTETFLFLISAPRRMGTVCVERISTEKNKNILWVCID